MGYSWRWEVFWAPVPSGGGNYLGWLNAGLRTTFLLSITAWVLILIYVKWTNDHYDHPVAQAQQARREGR